MEKLELEMMFIKGLLIECLLGFDLKSYDEAVHEVLSIGHVDEIGLGYMVNEFLRKYKEKSIENDPEYFEHLKRQFANDLNKFLREE